MYNFEGKKVVITGGTRGIGLATALRLKKEGATVLITGTKPNFTLLDDIDYYQVNFLVSQEIESFIGFLKKHTPDILINNAGINKINKFCDISFQDYMEIQQINTTVPFQLCQAVIPAMKKRGWGRIVNITSIWSEISKICRASYSTSKFALNCMTVALAAEVASEGILVNNIAPGFIETDMTKEILGKEGMENMAQQIPIKRLGKAEEIAALTTWLVSTENTYISGQNLIIDGGFTRV